MGGIGLDLCDERGEVSSWCGTLVWHALRVPVEGEQCPRPGLGVVLQHGYLSFAPFASGITEVRATFDDRGLGAGDDELHAHMIADIGWCALRAEISEKLNGKLMNERWQHHVGQRIMGMPVSKLVGRVRCQRHVVTADCSDSPISPSFLPTSPRQGDKNRPVPYAPNDQNDCIYRIKRDYGVVCWA